MTTPRQTIDLSSYPHQEIVVFLIGMKIHAWFKPWLWIPVMLAMGAMLRELSQQDPQRSGFLGRLGSGPGVMVQYWSSAEALQRYAADQQGHHFPAWAAFNKKLRAQRSVGIWHETYVVPTHRLESIYVHMPPTGLGTFLPLQPVAKGLHTATQRLQHHTTP